MGVDGTYQFRIPGPDGIWTHTNFEVEKNGNLAGVRRLMEIADISACSVVGHTDCAGHRVTDDEHRADTKKAAAEVKAALGIDKPVYAILAVRGDSDQDWHLEFLEKY